MIGDSPAADIAGAERLGLQSVWVSAGRPWTEPSYTPTLIAANAADAIAKALPN
jgi:putative hydrolase of the HAD superfamily